MSAENKRLRLVVNEQVRIVPPHVHILCEPSPCGDYWSNVQVRPLLYCYAGEVPEYVSGCSCDGPIVVPQRTFYVLNDNLHSKFFSTLEQLADRLGELRVEGIEAKRTTGVVAGLEHYWLLYEVHPHKVNWKERERQYKEHVQKSGFMTTPMLPEGLRTALAGPDERYRKLTPAEKIKVERLSGLRTLDVVR